MTNDEMIHNNHKSKWAVLLDACGDVLRTKAQDGETIRDQVDARTYTINEAAKRLGLRAQTIEHGISKGVIVTLTDPDGRTLIPAKDVESAYHDAAVYETIAEYERLKINDLVTASGLPHHVVRQRLQKAQVSETKPRWGQIRGHWNLPDTLREFHKLLQTRKQDRRASRRATRDKRRESRREEQKQRNELRQRLVEAFPTWQHADRFEQQILLHVGTPNSGKTHDALNALVDAEEGWYLAPLRLLAFEVFDRLNARGVPCNLLTGEEFIPIPGATITSATIEMFNPQQSGECVIIDEAQMLADSDRGWAWTRAMMESRAPEMHIIGPPTAEKLIKDMAEAAGLALGTIYHERLTPIRLAEKPWSLNNLPKHTILVAFSRRMVLHLKNELEEKNRSVSVVYGSLPPEVRRKQADRFANGETDICIATDAVGMGLNLPADCVCFYELEKFDGRNIRALRPEEVQQIGGRAGRYGLSRDGIIGATTKRDLKLLHKLYHQPATVLTHARVAPTVEDLAMIPGRLADQLVVWSELQSIPASMRRVIKTADMAERIELARMLTDEEVEHLGLGAAITLVNAPTRRSSRGYWRECATAILKDYAMPLPPMPPVEIVDGVDLEYAETCISCADIYLWLSRRREFTLYGVDEDEVRSLRKSWSMDIDAALVKKIDTGRRCPECNRPLSLRHKHRLCDACFFEGESIWE